MIEQVERLNRSISELLDYARPNMMNITRFNLDELVGRAVMLVRTDADSVAVSITERYGCGERQIEGDQDKLTQVVLNLCLNAIQAAESGGTLVISTSCSRSMTRIEISDSGCGIRADLKEKVFEPYFTTKHDGTGLGLAMSAKIIADHNGSIAIESEVGSGTTVVVELPALAEDRV
jgi:two-component system sensor histidine kinase HydH